MWITVFRNRLRDDAGPGYAEQSTLMKRLAQAQPGFVSIKTFTAEDGERVSLVEFESLETLLAWKNQPEHLEAQRLGREQFYAEYAIQSAEVARSYRWPAKSSPAETKA